MSLESDLVERLKTSARLVDEAAVPAEFRVVAFEQAFLGLGASGSASEELSRSETEPNVVGRPIDELAKRLNVGASEAAAVYEMDGDDVRLILRQNMLPNPHSKAAAMRDVALLVVAGRQAAGCEETTSWDVIRRECQEIRVYDGPNFASEIAKLEFRTSGSPRARTARATRHHLNECGELIRRVADKADG